ncbi:MAG: Uma2 family endonuclease [Gemmatimonadota bacterium]
MAMPLQRHWTTEDVRAITHEDRPWPRYELIDGELLVTPAPRGAHQLAAFEIATLLKTYSERERIGLVMLSPSDIGLRPDSITQPDVFVVPFGVAPADRVAKWSDIKSLQLAVEVLSPSSLRTDRVVKRDFYLANGVAEYWIVDLDARMFEVWFPYDETPSVHHAELRWTPSGRDPLIIDLAALFDRVETQWREISGRSV